VHPEDETEFDVRRVLRALRRHSILVVALTAAAVVIALVTSLLSTTLYAATAQVRIVDPSAEAVSAGGANRVDREREVQTQVVILKSRELEDAVADRLGDAAREIAGVSVAAVGNSDVIAIRVASPSPEVAQQAANAYAELYVEKRRDDVAAVFAERAERLRKSADDLQARISEVNVALAGNPGPLEAQRLQAERDSLIVQQAEMQRQAGDLEVQAATRTGNVTIVQYADLPSAPFSPTTGRNVVIWGLLGLLVGSGAAVVLDRLDDRVPAAGHPELGGVPVIGAIPEIGSRRRAFRHRDRQREIVAAASPDAEAFRTLATSVRFSAVGNDHHVLAITSAERGEGKSTIAANLAVALAEMGMKVVLVSADLRAPVLGEIFEFDESERGLTSVLLGDAPLGQCFRPVTLSTGRSFYLLPAGPAPSNPHELLSSARMAEVVASLTGTGADFILVDCPPVLPVGDTLALAHLVDGIAVVAAVGRTRLGVLEEAVDRLRKVSGKVVGAILNRTEPASRYGEYGYGYGSGARPRAARESRRVAGGNGSGPLEDPARHAGAVSI
jgi:non-specific protein-tyrosine kinase